MCKDGKPFIGKFKGYPYPVVAVWNPVNKQYVYSMLQVDLYQGEWEDAYFENVYVKESELLEWGVLEL